MKREGERTREEWRGKNRRREARRRVDKSRVEGGGLETGLPPGDRDVQEEEL